MSQIFRDRIKRASAQPVPKVADDEEVQTSEFEAPVFESGKPPAKFSSQEKKTSSMEAFKSRLAGMKKEPARVEEVPDISEVASIKPKAGGRLVNTRLVQANAAKPTVKLNVAEPAKTAFPYLIMPVEYDGDTAYLWHVNSKTIQLRYVGDIEIVVEGSTLRKTQVNEEWGYVFYTNNKKYLDKLDELLTPAWRDELQEALPEVIERNPDLLWEGDINGKHAELYDYTDKTVALFTDIDYTAYANEKLWLSNRYTHPTRGKIPGYCISKRGKGIDKLREIIPDNFGMKYTKSTPVSTVPIKARAGPSLLDERNVEIEETVFEMKTYDYTDSTFAIFFEPDIELDESGLMRNESLTVGGVKRAGYTFNKTNNKIKTMITELAPGIVLETVKEQSIVEDPTLAALIPAAKEEKIEDLLIKLIAKLNKLPEGKMSKVESRGKVIFYGNMVKISESLTEYDDEYELSLQGQITEEVGFQVLGKRA